jgi:Tetratricopeptide repeat
MAPRCHAPAAILVLLWTTLAGVSSASAQDDADAAKAHFSKGTRLYEVGEYRQALDEFKAAHLAKPDPAFLYNIAQCHRQLGDLEQAVTLYKRYLVASPNAANRADVEKRVAEMEAELAARKQRGAAEAPAAPVATQPAASPPAPVAAVPSPIAPVPSAPPMTATESAGTAPQPAAVTTVAEPPRAGSSLRYLRWVGVGLTVALAGGAVVSGVLASSKFDDLKKSCGATSAGCSDSDVNGLKSRALLTNILWGAAGVAAVGTGVLFYLTPRESAIQVAWRF